MTSLSSLSKAILLASLGIALLCATVVAALAFGYVPAMAGGAAALVVLGLAALQMARVSRLLHEVADVIAAGAAGDLDVRIFAIAEPGVMGRLQDGVNGMLDVADAFMREAAGSAEYLSQRKYFRKVLPTGLPGVFNIAARTMNRAADTMAANVEDFSRFAQTNVGGVVDGITSAATQLRSAAEAMTGMAQDLSSLTERIGGQAAHSSTIAGRVADDVSRTTTTVGKLIVAAQKVEHVINVIGEISRKTEMLSINATIEAAKAGELGRGFAVVASEVKALAQQTEEATKDIARQIKGMRDVVAEVEAAIGEIRGAVVAMSDEAKGIAAAIAEDTPRAGSPSIVSAVAGTSVASTQVLGAASDLMDEAIRLSDEITVFMDKVRAA